MDTAKSAGEPRQCFTAAVVAGRELSPAHTLLALILEAGEGRRKRREEGRCSTGSVKEKDNMYMYMYRYMYM